MSQSICLIFKLDKMLHQRLFFWSIYVLGISFSSTVEDTDYQLPKNVKPIRYNLTIVPNFDTNTFSGTVLIELIALETSNHITLHARELNMPPKEDIIVQKLGTNIALPVESAQYSNTKYEYFKISLSEMLINGTTYVLQIPNFNAMFSTNSRGFSNETFTDTNGSNRYIAFTQFQPNDARQAFPCFDEPALRAKFNIRLVRPSEQFISASNGRVISQSMSSPFVDIYEETLDMPTYLVAFTVSEMKFSETLDGCRIIARPAVLNANKHTYGLQMTVNVIDFMETYTGVPYDLPKLDAVAIHTFSGGMENWGLIVYGERFLFITFPRDKERIVTTIAHEVAHQWFGNLIGFTWWEYLWLSEGFATYFQSLIPVQVEPNIDSRGKFLYNMQSVLQDDMKLDTRPLTQNAETPLEIYILFDNIPYKKGGAVIHMLENSLTSFVFQRGLQYYVENMKFKLATPADLYQNLQRAVNENINTLPESLTVADFMASWETTKGFPVVDVQRNYGPYSNFVELTQTRYISNPVGEDGRWIIPINFATSNNLTFENTDPEYWITETRQMILVPYLNVNNWLIANKKETGYYRVNYDETNWNLITQTLMTNHLDIHVLNRAQLIDDSLNLAKTGRLSNDIAMRLVAYIDHEEDPIPWISYTINMEELKSMFYYSPNYHTLMEYNFNITKTVYNYVGFEEKVHETNLQKDLRHIILNFLCKIGHPNCLKKSLNKFKYWIKTRKNLSELETYTLCGAIQASNQENFDYLLNILKNNDNNINIIKSLSCTKNINNLNKLLQLNDKIPIDQIIETIMNSSPEGLQTAINFVSKKFAIIEKKLERKTEFLLKKISGLISTDHQLNKIKQAISNSKYAQLFIKLFALSEENIAWRKRNLKKIAKKLIFKV